MAGILERSSRLASIRFRIPESMSSTSGWVRRRFLERWEQVTVEHLLCTILLEELHLDQEPIDNQYKYKYNTEL